MNDIDVGMQVLETATKLIQTTMAALDETSDPHVQNRIGDVLRHLTHASYNRADASECRQEDNEDGALVHDAKAEEALQGAWDMLRGQS